MTYSLPVMYVGMPNRKLYGITAKKMRLTKEVITVTAAVCTVCTMSLVTSDSVCL